MDDSLEFRQLHAWVRKTIHGATKIGNPENEPWG